MKPITFVAILLLGAFLVAGCRRVPVAQPDGSNLAKKPASDLVDKALVIFRYPENPRSSDDATRFRDGVQSLSSLAAKAPKVSDQERKFLADEVHLNDDELAEVEVNSFRPADAHYLDECFLLRDAARSAEVTGLGSLAQTHADFRWVMRNVLLHEQVDDWTPPAATLRRGYGSAVDRALVFLALARQSQREGCLIVVPGSDPLQFLVAVLDPKTAKLHLFDSRLGLAVRGKDGKSIATLDEVLVDPTLLQPVGIAAVQAQQMEAWLICPLYALSPRMLQLQNALTEHNDPITLHLDGPKLAESIKLATKLPVKVWISPPQGKALPNSPTRSLRLFLPKDDGGIDTTNRAKRVADARMPLAGVEFNLASINVPQALPKLAYKTLLAICKDHLFQKYDLQPRELYLRGMIDPMLRRQERMRAFVDAPLLVGLAEDRDFREKELFEWSKKANEAYALLNDDDPKMRPQGQMLVAKLWAEDHFLGWMVETDKEETLDRNATKTAVTKIIAIGLRDYFRLELNRTLASANHEKAARLQASLDAAAQPSDAARTRAHGAWIDAHGAWANLYLANIPLEFTIDQRLRQLQRLNQPQDIELRVSMLESLHLDVQKYFHARLCLAECKLHLDGAAKSKSYLDETRKEITEMENKGLLKVEIKNLGAALQGLPPQVLPVQGKAFYQKRLDLLARDWHERGNYYWMKQEIR